MNRAALRVAGWTAVLLGAILLPSTAAAQSPQDPPESEVAESVLGYEREAFVYPGRGRRNPFRSLALIDTSRPRFEDLEVTGIVFSEEVGSIAVVADRSTNRRFRLREGERLGVARVVEIRPDEVVFTLSTFGVTREATLRVKKEQGE